MSSQKKNVLLLLVVFALSATAAAFDKGYLLGFFDRTKRNRAPADSKENLFYTRKKPCSSARVIDRSGFAFVNSGERITAVEIASGITVTVTEQEEGRAPILRFSEYAGYVYLLDGESLRRTGLDGARVSRVSDAVRAYEPMGDYVYFLREERGEPRLFRCWLTGSGQEMLFDYPVYDFHASAGRLLMRRDAPGDEEDRRYTCYNVLDQTSVDATLPSGASDVRLCESRLYYMTTGKGEVELRRRDLSGSDGETTVASGDILKWQVGPDGIALLLRDGDGCRLRYVDLASGGTSDFGGRTFSPDSEVDLSWDRIYITEPGAGIFYTGTETEKWSVLPTEAATDVAAKTDDRQ